MPPQLTILGYQDITITGPPWTWSLQSLPGTSCTRHTATSGPCTLHRIYTSHHSSTNQPDGDAPGQPEDEVGLGAVIGGQDGLRGVIVLSSWTDYMVRLNCTHKRYQLWSYFQLCLARGCMTCCLWRRGRSPPPPPPRRRRRARGWCSGSQPPSAR